MRRSRRLLTVIAGLTLLSVLLSAPGRTAAALPRDDANTLTILTCCGMPSGFTKAAANATNTIFTYYHYYHTLWEKRFPNLKINEIDVSSYADLTTKTILGVNAGNPPDLIGTQGQLGALVARKAVQNLDAYYKLYNITPSMFLPALANWARMQGHWYAMPENSNPSEGEILTIPAQVKAAGWDPTKIPRTWSELWTATQKVTKFDGKGGLVRIGVPVSGYSAIPINLYCGYFATYDPRTAKFHANSPCIKDYFRYQKRLLDFYGGVQAYSKFISGDPSVWSCSKKAYIPTGKIIFAIDAWWSGGQMDTCYPVVWQLSPPPTAQGTLSERRALQTTAQQAEIPTGAKHSRLAFEFAKFTYWDNGYVEGPTTNGYVLANQAARWAQTLIQVEGKIRAGHHYAGNPMVEALALTMQDAQLGQAFLPTDVAAPDYDVQMTSAWDLIRYGRASVDQALDQAQRVIDAKQRVLHAQFGM
jgi:ABC-type glycerol-3-phosphate transport system substrate-binding protein